MLLCYKILCVKHQIIFYIFHCFSYLAREEKRRRRHTLYSPDRNNDSKPTLKKSNSCSTIFIDDNTASQPNLKMMLKCVSLAIYYHVKNRDYEVHLLDIFDEQLHPLSKDKVPDNYNRLNPEHKHIYRFIKTLFSAAQLTSECAIITLVSINYVLLMFCRYKKYF